MIRNPILPGFNPDPSICRVGEDYYIATSTFEWYPGVQIHHSRDLVNWTLVRRVAHARRVVDVHLTAIGLDEDLAAVAAIAEALARELLRGLKKGAVLGHGAYDRKRLQTRINRRLGNHKVREANGYEPERGNNAGISMLYGPTIIDDQGNGGDRNIA